MVHIFGTKMSLHRSAICATVGARIPQTMVANNAYCITAYSWHNDKGDKKGPFGKRTAEICA